MFIAASQKKPTSDYACALPVAVWQEFQPAGECSFWCASDVCCTAFVMADRVAVSQ